MKIRNCFFTLLVVTLVSSSLSADMNSNVWSTGVADGAPGSFGTPGSVSGNVLSASITSGAKTANVTLTANNSDWFRTSGNITNGELVPFFENNSSHTVLTFSSDQALKGFDILFHNVNHSDSGDVNYIGNFKVTYEDGTVVDNAAPILRSIQDNTPFQVDALGGGWQPTDINSVYDGGDVFTITNDSFDPGNGANLGTYLLDPNGGGTQGYGIVSFDESIGSGKGIREVEFSWIGQTSGGNTAFVGFAGVAVPEPSSVAVVGILGIVVITRRRKN